MAILYSKGGEKVVIPHAIDIKEWLKDGYSYENPAEAKPEPKGGDSLSETTPPADPTPPEVTPSVESDADWFESVKDKLGSLGADDAKRAANFVGVPYTNKRDTIAVIKDTLK